MNRVTEILGIYLNADTRRYQNEHAFVNQNTLLLVGGICFVKIILIDIIFGRSGELVCLFIGFVYPAYRTTKAIESRYFGKDESDIIQWLMYWVVFAAFHLIEFFSDTILGWVPMYWLAKCVFLICCMSPLNLSSVIYEQIVVPAFKQNEAIMDKAVTECQDYLLDQCKKGVGIVGITSNVTRHPLIESAPNPTSFLSKERSVSNSPRRRKKRAAPPPPTTTNRDDL